MIDLKEKKFDPEGSDYDYETANAYKMQPKKKNEHWGSVAPTSDDERIAHDLPENSYVILKGSKHPTFDKAVKAEEQRGAKIIKNGDRYYSVYKNGGKVSSASKRADGIAKRGKTRGKMV